MAALRSEQAALRLVSSLRQEVAKSGLLSNLIILPDFGVTGAEQQNRSVTPSPSTNPEVMQQLFTHLLAAQYVVMQQSHKTLHQVP